MEANLKTQKNSNTVARRNADRLLAPGAVTDKELKQGAAYGKNNRT